MNTIPLVLGVCLALGACAAPDEGSESSSDALRSDGSQPSPSAPVADTPAGPAAPLALRIGTYEGGRNKRLRISGTCDEENGAYVGGDLLAFGAISGSTLRGTNANDACGGYTLTASRTAPSYLHTGDFIRVAWQGTDSQLASSCRRIDGYYESSATKEDRSCE